MHPLATKTHRTGILYVLLCLVALAWSQRERLGWCVDWRLALLREFARDEARAPDVLFLGSSYTVRGIRPLVAEEVFAASSSPLRSGLNLGTNGTPRPVNALVLEDWLAHHPAPKVVCVEFGTADIVPYPHQLSSNLATPADAVRLAVHAPYFVRDSRGYSRMVALNKEGKAFGFEQTVARRHWHFEAALDVLGRGPEDLVRTAFNGLANAWEARSTGTAWRELRNPYWSAVPPIDERTLREQIDARGWYRMDPEHELLRKGRELVEKKALEKPKAEWILLRSDERFPENPMYAATELYTERIVELCRERGIRLVFYYLPSFRDRLPSEALEAWIRSQGEVFWPDLNAQQEPENYADTGHLSDLGAERYTRALAEFLSR